MAQATLSVFGSFNSSAGGIFLADTTVGARIPGEFFSDGTARTISGSRILGAQGRAVGQPYQMFLNVSANILNLEHLSMTFTSPDGNSFTIDDWSQDTSAPYSFIVQDADTRAAMNAFVNGYGSGNTTVLISNDRPVDLAIAAKGEPATADINVEESDTAFSFTWAITSSSGTWAEIGARSPSDDVAIPSDILQSGALSDLDQLRSRNSQIRLFFDSGVGRFTTEFENAGLIRIVNDATNTDIAVLRNIGSFWNKNNRYQINSDAPFVTGTLRSLRSAIEALGKGALIRMILVRPAEGIGISASAEPATASINVELPLGVSASAEPGIASVRVIEPALGITADADSATADINIERQTKLAINASAEPGIASVRVIEPALGITAAGEPASADINVERHTGLSLNASAEPGTASVRVIEPTLAIAAKGEPGTANIEVENNKQLEIRASAEPATANINVENQIDLGITAAAEPGTASVRIAEPTLGITAAGEPASADINVERHTGLSLNASAEPATASVRIVEPTLSVSAAAESGTADVNVMDNAGLSIDASAEPATANINVVAPTLSVTASADPATANVNVEGGKSISIAASADPATANINVEKRIGLKISAAAEPASAQIDLQAPSIKIGAASDSGRASVGIGAPGVKILAVGENGAADINLPVYPGIRALAEPGTADIGLFGPIDLRISAKSAPGRASIKMEAPYIKIYASGEEGAAMINIPLPDRPRNRRLEMTAPIQADTAQHSTSARKSNFAIDARPGKHRA